MNKISQTTSRTENCPRCKPPAWITAISLGAIIKARRSMLDESTTRPPCGQSGVPPSNITAQSHRTQSAPMRCRVFDHFRKQSMIVDSLDIASLRYRMVAEETEDKIGMWDGMKHQPRARMTVEERCCSLENKIRPYNSVVHMTYILYHTAGMQTPIRPSARVCGPISVNIHSFHWDFERPLSSTRGRK